LAPGLPFTLVLWHNWFVSGKALLVLSLKTEKFALMICKKAIFYFIILFDIK
jgi:hypothetical protein